MDHETSFRIHWRIRDTYGAPTVNQNTMSVMKTSGVLTALINGSTVNECHLDRHRGRSSSFFLSLVLLFLPFLLSFSLDFHAQSNELLLLSIVSVIVNWSARGAIHPARRWQLRRDFLYCEIQVSLKNNCRAPWEKEAEGPRSSVNLSAFGFSGVAGGNNY